MRAALAEVTPHGPESPEGPAHLRRARAHPAGRPPPPEQADPPPPPPPPRRTGAPKTGRAPQQARLDPQRARAQTGRRAGGLGRLGAEAAAEDGQPPKQRL